MNPRIWYIEFVSSISLISAPILFKQNFDSSTLLKNVDFEIPDINDLKKKDSIKSEEKKDPNLSVDYKREFIKNVL